MEEEEFFNGRRRRRRRSLIIAKNDLKRHARTLSSEEQFVSLPGRQAVAERKGQGEKKEQEGEEQAGEEQFVYEQTSVLINNQKFPSFAP